MKTNIVIVLADDLGFSDIGCYGGEAATPNLDALAREGVRASAFYNTARCSPSRASLLTGRHPHETGVGVLNDDDRPDGYAGTLTSDIPTLAELLVSQGYATCLSGKWHLSARTDIPNESWPTRRGFDEFYGILGGAGSYFGPALYHGEERVEVGPQEDFYLTDALSEHAAGFIRSRKDSGAPFFLYLAYTAPHWPLQAREEDIVKYQSTFGAGWDSLRQRRLERLHASGTLPTENTLSKRDVTQPAWSDVQEKGWEARRMATYAAQVEAMDRGVGAVMAALFETGQADDTLVLFLSDNGGCAEELPPPDAPLFARRNPSVTRAGRPIRLGNDPSVWPGSEDTYASYGRAWANLSNTPFRLYKRWVHEGGIATPLIVRWPRGNLDRGKVVHRPHQLTDVLPTLIHAVGGAESLGARYQGVSMLPSLRGEPAQEQHILYWEHLGNCAARDGRWKIVRLAGGDWELYDMEHDRAEEHDLALASPAIVQAMAERWNAWAERCGVIPWTHLEKILSRRTQGVSRPPGDETRPDDGPQAGGRARPSLSG